MSELPKKKVKKIIIKKKKKIVNTSTLDIATTQE